MWWYLVYILIAMFFIVRIARKNYKRSMKRKTDMPDPWNKGLP